MSLLLLPGMGSGPNLMTPERSRSQFNLHCVFAANMLMTGNLSAVSDFVLSTWGNAEAVGVNQEPVYEPFLVLKQVHTERGPSYHSKPLTPNTVSPTRLAWYIIPAQPHGAPL